MRRLTRPVAVAFLGAALLGACGGDSKESQPTGTAGLATKTVEVGEVTVKLTPQRIDRDGAAFEVVFDTHSVELDLDVAANARLVVDRTAWAAAAWDGAAPGGHHREGTLRFTAAGDVAGTVELIIAGLSEPVRATWNLKGQ